MGPLKDSQVALRYRCSTIPCLETINLNVLYAADIDLLEYYAYPYWKMDGTRWFLMLEKVSVDIS